MNKKIITVTLAVMCIFALGFAGCGEAEEFPINDITKDIEFDIKIILDPEIVLNPKAVLTSGCFDRIFAIGGCECLDECTAEAPSWWYPLTGDAWCGLTERFLSAPTTRHRTAAEGGPTIGPDDFFSLSEEFIWSLGLTRDNFRSARLDFLYMDTPDQTFNQHRWINRFRQRNWEDGWHLMSRRRTSLRWPVTERSIEAAVQQALADGFVPECMGGEWLFEVDWSYTSAVLTKTRQYRDGPPLPIVPFAWGLGRGDIPTDEQIIELYMERLPPTLKAQYWFDESLMTNSVRHGVVFYRRYEARIDHIIDCPHWAGANNFRIDVLALPAVNGFGIEFVIEASHANMDMSANLGLANASATRDTLKEFLRGGRSDVILPVSGLRAGKVKERFRIQNER